MRKRTNLIYPSLLLAILILFTSNCVKAGDIVKDIDGNFYHTVTIGTQVWMVENLKTTKYRNGDPIPNVTNNSQWTKLTTCAYCNYENKIVNGKDYGHLYNWYAINDSRHIAPKGWHVPSDAEWTTLTNYLGGENVAGGKLKETGITHWKRPNSLATNESGFTGLPGGYRSSSDGSFCEFEINGSWWRSSDNNTYNAWYRGLQYDDGQVYKSYLGLYKCSGFSIRCIRD